MEKIVKLDGQNISVPGCIVNINNADDINRNVLLEDFDEETNDSRINIFLFKNFLQHPQFINDMNFELFIDFLNSIPYDKSINGTISFLEDCINNINKFNPDFVDEILLKIINKLYYDEGIITGNEILHMSFDMDHINHNTINETSVFKSIILPLINSSDIELTKKITNLIFKHSQKEFCFLFLRTCFEFRDMIPQNFLYSMFGIGERSEVHNTIKEFIINNIQNIIILLTYNCDNYKNIDFILMYLNEIVNENKNFILETFGNSALTYNVTHRWSVSEHIINIKNIKNLELKLFIQNLMSGISTPIIERPIIGINQKLQEFLLNFNDIVSGKIEFYDEIINEIMILCEYGNNTEYVLQKLLEINFMNGRLISNAINIFFTHYYKIQNVELKKIYIELINQKNLDFVDILNFVVNYEKFDEYLKSSIQEKFSKFVIELFEDFIQMPSMYKYELVALHMLCETIHKNKANEILLPIFIENAKYLNKEQQIFIKRYLFSNVFSSEARSININFEMDNKEYQLCNAKKINKSTLIKCLDLFYNNIKCFYESERDIETITIANLPLIINIIDKLECNIEEKLQLKTKIFLDIEEVLSNTNIKLQAKKDDAIIFLLTEITKSSVQNPKIISYFLTNSEENKIKKTNRMFLTVSEPLDISAKILNKQNNEIIFDVLLVVNKENKIKLQKSFINCLDINLKKGNINLLNTYCKHIKKFDEEFQQIILYKAFECGIKDFNLTSSKTQQK